MNDLNILILVPLVLLTIGWGASLVLGDWIRVCSRIALTALLISLMVLAISGYSHDHKVAGNVHLWLGHYHVIGVWQVMPLVAGVTIGRVVGWRVVKSIAIVMAMIVVMGLTLSASMMGYMGPSRLEPDYPFAEETYYRFLVLHTIMLPLITGGLLAMTWWSLRPRRNAIFEESRGPDGDICVSGDSSNPYRPPESL